MRKRAFAALLSLGFLVLASCDQAGNTQKVSKQIATECITNAIDSTLRTEFPLAQWDGPKTPLVLIEDMSVEKCESTGPGTVDCLTEYKASYSSGMALSLAMRGVDVGDGKRRPVLAKWRFLLGTQGTRCSALE